MCDLNFFWFSISWYLLILIFILFCLYFILISICIIIYLFIYFLGMRKRTAIYLEGKSTEFWKEEILFLEGQHIYFFHVGIGYKKERKGRRKEKKERKERRKGSRIFLFSKMVSFWKVGLAARMKRRFFLRKRGTHWRRRREILWLREEKHRKAEKEQWQPSLSSHEIQRRDRFKILFGHAILSVRIQESQWQLPHFLPMVMFYCCGNCYRNMGSREDCPSGLWAAYALVKLSYDNVNLRVDMGVRDEASRNSTNSGYIHWGQIEEHENCLKKCQWEGMWFSSLQW